MSSAFNWRCPFCNHNSTVTDDRLSVTTHYFDKGNKYGPLGLQSLAVVCANEDCKEVTLTAILMDATWGAGRWTTGDERERWQLLPAANVKPFPDYVPGPILADYREACLIRDLSPKASATLSRRCLQGMIRDYWGISKSRLVDEIEAIHEKVDPITWDAIDAVRNIGNIGAHMERDINLVIDVEPQEAALLIGLIETLVTEWYVNRHERQQRMAKLVAVAADKKMEKAGK